MEQERAELLCAISKYEAKIREIAEWREGEYKEKQQALRDLHVKLDEAIADEEKYRRIIANKLNKIENIKEQIANLLPPDGGLKVFSSE